MQYIFKHVTRTSTKFSKIKQFFLHSGTYLVQRKKNLFQQFNENVFFFDLIKSKLMNAKTYTIVGNVIFSQAFV